MATKKRRGWWRGSVAFHYTRVCGDGAGVAFFMYLIVNKTMSAGCRLVLSAISML